MLRCVLFALLFPLIAAGAALRAQAADPAEIGVVKSVSGDAQLERSGADRPIEVGASLRKGDRIATGADGAVGFTLADGSRFSIGPNSAIVVSEFQFQPDRGLLALIADFLFGTMTHASGEIGRIEPDAVRITTPLGVVGVRGTRFAIKQPKLEGARP